MILNVGCGDFPSGDVNVDVEYHRGVDVLCDAHFLPFNLGVFDVVVCDNVLEHCRNPLEVLCELLWVCLGRILVFVPTWWREVLGRVKDKSHKWVFSSGWFEGLGLRCKVSVCRWWLVFPFEFRVDILL